MTLQDFITGHREDLIDRCKVKAAGRQELGGVPPPSDHGVPLFLEQLRQELVDGPSKNDAIHAGASLHGQELLLRSFNISQVVHGYGDICQSVTDLAVELDAPIATGDFRTLNRCLDDAIAGAVTAYSLQEARTRHGQSNTLRGLVNTAITALDVLLAGSVGVGGSTGQVLVRSLHAIRTHVDERHSDDALSKN